MLEIVTEATFIYFIPVDIDGTITMNQIFEAEMLANRHGMYMSFEHDNEHRGFSMWINHKVLDDSEAKDIATELRSIFNKVELDIKIERLSPGDSNDIFDVERNTQELLDEMFG